MSRYCIKVELKCKYLENILNELNDSYEIPYILKLNERDYKIYKKHPDTNYQSWLVSNVKIANSNKLTLYLTTSKNNYEMVIEEALNWYSNELYKNVIELKIINEIIINPDEFESNNDNIKINVIHRPYKFLNAFNITYISIIIIYLITFVLYGIFMNKFAIDFCIENTITIILFLAPFIVYQKKVNKNTNYHVVKIDPRKSSTEFEYDYNISSTTQPENESFQSGKIK